MIENLLKTHLETIFNYALFITGNREKALDLMQDTIVTVLSKKHLYTEESHFKSWIFRILKNNFLNQIKRNSIINEVYFPDISKENENIPLFSTSYQNFIAEEASDPILKNKITQVFATMPEEYREVTLLVEIEGMSYEETAKTLQIPVGTVMSRLHRSRLLLKKAFKREAVELKIISQKEKHA